MTTPIAGSSYRVLPRRRFSKDTKRELVEEFLGSSVSLARFARDRDLHTNQFARWRREYLAGEYGAPGPQPQSEWVEVTVTEREAPEHVRELAVSQAERALVVTRWKGRRGSPAGDPAREGYGGS